MKTMTRGFVATAAACLAVPAFAQSLDPGEGTHQLLAANPADRENVQDEGGARSVARTKGGEARTRRGIEEVIVTAQKREERLQDVPVSVTAIDADVLSQNNEVRLQDYFSTVPGLNLTNFGYGGASYISIRGITTGNTANPTVATVIDDVPFGSSIVLGGASATTPDLDPSNIARIEVLRGPQGALYGASGSGGLIKYVTLDPSTSEVSGRMHVGVSSVQNGAELGYSVRGALNVPLSDTFAVRLSGSTRLDPGYIDVPSFISDPDHGKRGINETQASGAWISALWKPSELLSAKFSALFQHNDTRGASMTDITLGDLQARTTRQPGRSRDTIQLYSATVNAKLGKWNLTSVTGYSIRRYAPFADGGDPPWLPTVSTFGVPNISFDYTQPTKKFTQEVRFSAPLGDRLDWLIGGFYNDENSPAYEFITARDAYTGDSVGSWLHLETPATFKEYAAFTNLTVHVTSRFDVDIGGRESKNKQTYSSVGTGPWYPTLLLLPSPQVIPEKRSEDSSFTYVFAPRFRISDDASIYARMASGYRPGGPNSIPGSVNVPQTYGPDKTISYETGLKGSFIDHTVAFDASIYYIDWKDIQIAVYDPLTLTQYNTNASRARSQGVEVSMEWRPASFFKIAGSFAYSDAELTEGFPIDSPVSGAPGDRLPFSGRLSGNISVSSEFPISSNVDGFAGASISYVDDRTGSFRTTGAPRAEYPAYSQVDINGGARFGEWTTNIFVNNVTNRRGVLNGGADGFPGINSYYFILPRTIGWSISKDF